MFNIQEVILYLLVLVAVIMVVFLLYAKYIAPKIGKVMPQELLDKARAMAIDVVYYIEQILPGETGENKKLAARDKLKSLLDEVNINISDNLLDMLIEAAVFLMNTEILGNIAKYKKESDA